MPKLADLQEARARAVSEMRSLTDTADGEGRDLTNDEDKRFKELKAEVAELDRKIERQRDLDEAERRAPAVLHNGRGDGNFEERAREFSLTKVIRNMLPDFGGEDVGFEREISAEVQRRARRPFQGIAVPDEVFLQEKRTLLVGSTAAAVYPEVHRDDLFVDRLRDALVTGRLGATILDGLVGTIDIPKQTGSSTGQWIAEDGDLSSTDASFTTLEMSPKTIGAVTTVSRRTLINAVPSVEQIVRNDLAAVVANAIDHQSMVGDGSSNTPTGVSDGATSLTLATPTWAQVLEFIAEVQGNNADVGALGWAMNAHAVKKLRSTLIAADTDSRHIMMTPDNLAGFPVAVTNSLAGDPGPSPDEAAEVIFGAWSQLLIGYWTGVDILVNPYDGTQYLKGGVLVRAMRDVDVQVRHAESFAYAADLPVS